MIMTISFVSVFKSKLEMLDYYTHQITCKNIQLQRHDQTNVFIHEVLKRASCNEKESLSYNEYLIVMYTHIPADNIFSRLNIPTF